MMRNIFALLLAVLLFGACSPAVSPSPSDKTEAAAPQPNVLIEESDSLIVYRPQFATIDLECCPHPDETDSTIIFCASGAFTGQLSDTFFHRNIACDHVSHGQRYRGFPLKRSNGAFLCHDGQWRFVHQPQASDLDEAAVPGGMAFMQEMMIHEGVVVPHTRPDGNRNTFRALCEVDSTLAVIESLHDIAFGEFISALLRIGVREALYLDMGSGWNYSWYRDAADSLVHIHNVKIPYNTNWVVFRKASAPGAPTAALSLLADEAPTFAVTRTPHDTAWLRKSWQGLPYREASVTVDNDEDEAALVLFLHGTNGEGTDNVRHHALEHGQKKMLDYMARHRISGTILMPQCPVGQNWASQMNKLKSLLDNYLQNGHGSHRRVYIAGTSKGAIGVWDMLAWYGRFFAAAMPVAHAPRNNSNGVPVCVVTGADEGNHGNTMGNLSDQVDVKYWHRPTANHGWTCQSSFTDPCLDWLFGSHQKNN